LVRAEDKPSGEVDGREVVVGQQGDPEDSAAALGFAFRTAAAGGATVRRARAWTRPPVFAYSPGSLRLMDEAGGLEPYEQQALAAALAPWRERYPDVHVVEHVEMGSAGQVLLSVAGTAQLMVVGRRARRTAAGARIGSVAHGVLHHADCPGAVVPQSCRGRGPPRLSPWRAPAGTGSWAGCARCSPRRRCPGRCRAGPAPTGTSGAPAVRGRSPPGPSRPAAPAGRPARSGGRPRAPSGGRGPRRGPPRRWSGPSPAGRPRRAPQGRSRPGWPSSSPGRSAAAWPGSPRRRARSGAAAGAGGARRRRPWARR